MLMHNYIKSHFTFFKGFSKKSGQFSANWSVSITSLSTGSAYHGIAWLMEQ